MKNEKVKLNLGCGPSGIGGWINYDWGVLPLLSKLGFFRRLLVKLGILSKSYEVGWPKIRLVDIRRGLGLKNGSVDFIYCSHVLEHFERWEAQKILGECWRVLRTGGRLRVVVPDLEKMIKNYEGADKFCREFYGFNKDEGGWQRRFIRSHQWMYDWKSLRKILKNVGFVKIGLCGFREGETPDLDQLDLEVHQSLSLYAEAEK